MKYKCHALLLCFHLFISAANHQWAQLRWACYWILLLGHVNPALHFGSGITAAHAFGFLFVVGLSARKLSPWPFGIHNHILWIISPFVLVESPPWLFNPYPPGAVWKFGDVASKKNSFWYRFLLKEMAVPDLCFCQFLSKRRNPRETVHACKWLQWLFQQKNF